MADPQEDRSSWTRLSTSDYEKQAYEKAISIVTRIIAGDHPMGVVNLLSSLPLTIWYPYRGQADRIAAKIWGQLTELMSKADFPKLGRYNFEIFVRDAGFDLEGKALATIIFRYNPDDVRDLALPPGETPE